MPTARPRETTGTSAQPYDRRCRVCGRPITMLETKDGWKAFERAVSNSGKNSWVPHDHNAPVLRSEPPRRERGIPPNIDDWPEKKRSVEPRPEKRSEPRARPKAQRQWIWIKLIGLATALVYLLERWLSHN
jgi:hypothetical protein